MWAFSHMTRFEHEFYLIGTVNFLTLATQVAGGASCMVFFLLLFSAAGLIGHSRSASATFLMLIILTFFCVYLLVEIQQRYLDFAMFFAVILTSAGIERLYKLREDLRGFTKFRSIN